MNIITMLVRYFKLGRIILQGWSGILNWDEYYYKVGQVYQKQQTVITILQRVSGTTNWNGYYYKECQLFQTGKNIITMWVRYLKLGGILVQSGSGTTTCNEYN